MLYFIVYDDDVVTDLLSLVVVADNDKNGEKF